MKTKNKVLALLALLCMASMTTGSLRVLQHLPDNMYAGTTSEVVNFNCSVQGQDLRNISMQLDGTWKTRYNTLSAGTMNWTNWSVKLSTSTAVQWWSCRACNGTECVETQNKSIFILTGLCASNCTITSALVGSNINVTYGSGWNDCLTWCNITNTSGWCNPRIDLIARRNSSNYNLELLEAGRLTDYTCAAYWHYQCNASNNDVVVLSNNTSNLYVATGLVTLVAASIAYLLRRRGG